LRSLSSLNAEIKSIESYLKINSFNSMQRTVRDIEDVKLFHAIHAPNKGMDRKIEGFIRSPNADDIHYEIDLSREGVPVIEIILGSNNRANDLEKVKSEIPHLFDTAGIRRAAMGKPGGGGSGKKGYYLIVGLAQKKALANFKGAVQAGIASNDFVEFCIQRNFKMTFYS
jgi:hypothetical protein